MFVSVLNDGETFSDADNCRIFNVFTEADTEQIEYLISIDYPDVQLNVASDGYLEIRVEKNAKVRIV